MSQLAMQYGRSTSTICTISKKREEIKKLDVAKGVKTIHSTKQRPKLLEDVEKPMLLWISDKQLAGDSISEPIICAKAKALCLDVVKKTPGTTSEDLDAFKASRGWFENFKEVSGRAINLFNENALSHFRDMLKRREKQISLDRFLVKQPKRQQSDSEPQPGPSEVKFRKIRRVGSSSESEDSLSPQ